MDFMGGVVGSGVCHGFVGCDGASEEGWSVILVV